MYIPDIKTAGKLNIPDINKTAGKLNVYTRHQQNSWEVKCIYQTSIKQQGS